MTRRKTGFGKRRGVRVGETKKSQSSLLRGEPSRLKSRDWPGGPDTGGESKKCPHAQPNFRDRETRKNVLKKLHCVAHESIYFPEDLEQR